MDDELTRARALIMAQQHEIMRLKKRGDTYKMKVKELKKIFEEISENIHSNFGITIDRRF